MVGLDDWDFPELWTTVDGDRVVSMFLNRIPGADGSWHEVPGVSVMEYAGDGRFRAETDLINMVHIHEAIGDSGWSPTGADERAASAAAPLRRARLGHERTGPVAPGGSTR